ncbi:hypothetical protein PBY51_016067 [Eleginops maclovinus]|uniref:Uncharacterized protein n=1 Tax=Eleginops maclovinus TaxID=56733 RepID=A0AAN7XMK0_ELEMC|nr:hypothetical protein PBY51_016067 [Eleginops maclovinus]
MISRKRALLRSAADGAPLSRTPRSCYSPAGHTRSMDTRMMATAVSCRRRKGSAMQRRDLQCLIITSLLYSNLFFA